MKGRDFWAEGTVNTQGQWWDGAYPISEDKRPAPSEREKMRTKENQTSQNWWRPGQSGASIIELSRVFMD